MRAGICHLSTGGTPWCADTTTDRRWVTKIDEA
jgi:hypothetical protein